jgi:hypothetical protein
MGGWGFGWRSSLLNGVFGVRCATRLGYWQRQRHSLGSIRRVFVAGNGNGVWGPGRLILMAGFCKAGCVAWGLECGPFIECETDLGIIDDMT